MTAEECNERAVECGANASLAVSEPIAHEFIRLAAQWRAMATRTIFLGSIGDPEGSFGTLCSLQQLS
jgi:hypothetical protein